MTFCSNCGHQLADGAKFCFECGAKVNAYESQGTQRKTVYDGEIHKCPNCGDVMDPFEIKCDACGYELRSAKATNSVKEFESKLENAKSVNARIALIKTFAIPNAKEDIYDFFILAISNIEAGGDETDAWLAKLEQTYQKARLLFGSNTDFSYFQELYDKAHKHKTKRKIGAFMAKWWMCLLGALVTVIGVYLMVNGFFKGAESGDPDSPYYALACISFLITGGGGTLFGLGIRYGIAHSKHKR